MATKKKLLQAAAGTAAASGGGAAGLNVEDVFSTYLYEGNGSSQYIDNGINLGQSNDGGSFELFGVDGDEFQVAASTDFEMGSGDFTVECFIRTTVQSSGDGIITYATGGGASNTQWGMFTGYAGATSVDFYLSNGSSYFANTGGGNVTDGDWHHVAFCRSGSSGYLFVDGTQVGSTLSLGSTSLSPTSLNLNIGSQDSGYSFNGNISNVRIVKGTALYTANFTAPTSALTAVTNTVLLTGQGSASEVTNDNSSSSHSVVANGGVTTTSFGPFDAADAGEGGLVWIKDRDAANGHNFYDTERGATKRLASNLTSAETTRSTGVTSFNASGFSGGSDASINTSGNTYASWTFRKAPKFFTCLTYSGNGATGTSSDAPQTISHDLGSTPAVIFVKKTSGTGSWLVFHRSTGSSKYLKLDTTGAAVDDTSDAGAWANYDPTSTDFKVGWLINDNGATYVAYLFAHNDGDGTFGPTGDQDVIRCGSYTGTGAAGNFVNVGFEPQWLLTKRTDQAGNNWVLQDNMRSMSHTDYAFLYANVTTAEQAADLAGGTAATVPNGYIISNTGGANNASGGTYIYIAIRRGPMAVPTDATDVFAIDTRTGDRPSFTSNFVTDFALARDVSQTWEWVVAQRLTQGKIFEGTNDTDAEYSSSSFKFDYQDGYAGLNGSNANYYSWMWKRAPSFCDVVAYTGNGTAGRTVSHNLGVAPEMMWIKRRDAAQDWKVYHTGLTSASYYLDLNGSAAESASTVFAGTDPTDVVFSVGSNNSINASGGTYIAYLFASLDGVSKVGSFTHTAGTNTTVDCGFSNGPRFVLIKRTSSAGQWNVLDAERGIVVGNDPYLDLNQTNAESSAYDFIDPTSSGFTVDGSGVLTTATYIFYAIA